MQAPRRCLAPEFGKSASYVLGGRFEALTRITKRRARRARCAVRVKQAELTDEWASKRARSEAGARAQRDETAPAHPSCEAKSFVTGGMFRAMEPTQPTQPTLGPCGERRSLGVAIFSGGRLQTLSSILMDVGGSL